MILHFMLVTSLSCASDEENSRGKQGESQASLACFEARKLINMLCMSTATKKCFITMAHRRTTFTCSTVDKKHNFRVSKLRWLKLCLVSLGDLGGRPNKVGWGGKATFELSRFYTNPQFQDQAVETLHAKPQLSFIKLDLLKSIFDHCVACTLRFSYFARRL